MNGNALTVVWVSIAGESLPILPQPIDRLSQSVRSQPALRLQSAEQFENALQNRYYSGFTFIADTALHGVLRVIQDRDFFLCFPFVCGMEFATVVVAIDGIGESNREVASE